MCLSSLGRAVPEAGLHWKWREGTPPLPPPGRPAYAQPLSPWRGVPASMAFVTDSNRPPTALATAYVTASGAASKAPSLLMRPWPEGSDRGRGGSPSVGWPVCALSQGPRAHGPCGWGAWAQEETREPPAQCVGRVQEPGEGPWAEWATNGLHLDGLFVGNRSGIVVPPLLKHPPGGGGGRGAATFRARALWDGGFQAASLGPKSTGNTQRLKAPKNIFLWFTPELLQC